MYRLRTFTGTVGLWHPQRAYGWVRLDGTTREAHFHIADCEGLSAYDIKSGVTRLRFYLENHPKGLRAIRISKETVD